MTKVGRFGLACSFAICAILAGFFLSVNSPSPTTFIMLGLMIVLASIVVLNLFTISPQASTDMQQAREFKQKETDHQLLLETVHCYPMPFAIYDDKDQLQIWNKAYEKIYSRVFDKHQNTGDLKGMNYEDLLRSNMDDDLLNSEMEVQIKKRVAEQQQERQGRSVQENGIVNDRSYPDLGWYRVSKYRTPSGGVAGIAVDINELKEREEQLVAEIEHRKSLEIEIRKIANTDELSGISNRRHFMDMAKTRYEQAISDGYESAILMIDIDNFKGINDSFGHASGDEVIKTVSSTLFDAADSNHANCGRMGGEEFVVLLTDTSMEQARNFAETIREKIATMHFLLENGAFNVTVSIGVAASKDPQTTLSLLLKQADDALYSSKNAGRNCVTLSDQLQHELNQKKAG